MNPTEDPDPVQKYSVQEERVKFGEEKPKVKDTARLIWASKPRKEPNPKDLEFQTAEEVYPNVADARDHQLAAYTTNGRKIADQPNRLIWGDNLLVMQAMLAQGYEGQIDLIYIDPPFNTGENFNFNNEVKIGEATYEKELPINERIAYTDTWSRGMDSFLDMLYPRLQLMRKLLSDKGSIYVHCDWHISHYIRVILDEIFTQGNFLNEIVWNRTRAKHSDAKKFGNVHDTILVYAKSEKYFFEPQSIPHKEDYLKRFNKIDEKGQRYRLIPGHGAGQGPARMFFGKLIEPPAGRHWAHSQENIDQMINDGNIELNSNGFPEVKQYLKPESAVYRSRLVG